MTAARLMRKDFAQFWEISPRWRDNDVYGHVNNAVFYEYVDTAVNGWLIASGALDVPRGDSVGLVVHSECDYFAPLAFPDPVSAGLRTGRVGRSSVAYEVGLFAKGTEDAAAVARFVHVYVGREDHRPRPLPERLRGALAALGPPEGART